MYVYKHTGFNRGQIVWVDSDGRETPMLEKSGSEVEFQSECLRLNREVKEDREKGYYF